MKEWWLNLSLREKQTLVLGALCFALLSLYLLIWSPLAKKVENLRQQVQHNQQLLAWMQTADKHIQTLEKTRPTPREVNHERSLLSQIQDEIEQNNFAKNITQLRQTENDSVTFNLQQISFDQLITWLSQLWQQDDIIVTQITLAPLTPPSPGKVTGECSLQQGKS